MSSKKVLCSPCKNVMKCINENLLLLPNCADLSLSLEPNTDHSCTISADNTLQVRFVN